MAGPAFFTTDEAAVVAHRHPGSIRRALEAGDLHGSQRVKGGVWLIRPACLDAYLEGLRCEHQAPSSNVRLLRQRAV